MNSVAPSRRASARSGVRAASRGSDTSSTPPRPLRRAGRGRSAGSSSSAGAPAERSPPAGELPLQHVALQPLALPHRVVGVLDRQLGERRGCAPGEGAVERRQLAVQDAQRPAVRPMWCRVTQQHVVVRGQAQEAGAEADPRQVEGTPCLVPDAALRLRLALHGGEGGQVGDLQDAGGHGPPRPAPGRRPAPAGRCAAPRAGVTVSRRLRSRAATSSAPRRRSASGTL